MQLPKDIIHFFAKSHIPIRLQLEFLKEELTADLKSRMDELMRAIPKQVFQARLAHPDYQGTHDDSTDEDTEWDTRKEILLGLISRQTNQVRIQMLHNDSGQDRVAPYDHEALLDLDVDEDNLVALDQFELKNRRFERKGYVFELALTLLAENSSYWLKKNLLALANKVSMAVRLDPLAIQSQSEYREAMYKMWVYGVPLDWNQIVSLREDLHGRWMPNSPLGTPSSFTDVVWSPRGDEVHFLCEEVPLQEDVQERGSRYFHSILQRATGNFIHVDGAIRFYTKDELHSRLETHVRHTGKVGHRIKIFRVEGEIEPEMWGGLASSFFVWNEDVMSYLANASGFPEGKTSAA